MQFKSGMLQSWNKFCFTTGYIEGEYHPRILIADLLIFPHSLTVSVVFPGNADSSGYVSLLLVTRLHS
jgi:hypothetical protein